MYEELLNLWKAQDFGPIVSNGWPYDDFVYCLENMQYAWEFLPFESDILLSHKNAFAISYKHLKLLVLLISKLISVRILAQSFNMNALQIQITWEAALFPTGMGFLTTHYLISGLEYLIC